MFITIPHTEIKQNHSKMELGYQLNLTAIPIQQTLLQLVSHIPTKFATDRSDNVYHKLKNLIYRNNNILELELF